MTEALEQLSEHVYRYADICNVYVLKKGRAALLVDFGTGAVMEHLRAIGVEKIEWVLHTHHHRDQCQGDVALAGTDVRIAVPEREAYLFEDVEGFWQRKNVFDLYDLENTFNSLTGNVAVHRRLRDYEHFEWQGLRFLTLPTPGHTRGAVTYLTEVDGIAYAFCGDLVYGDGCVWSVHDLQWDYSRPDALNVAIQSVRVLRRSGPERLAPSHGPVPDDAGQALRKLEQNMLRLFGLVAGNFRANLRAPVPAALEVELRRVTDHLIEVRHCAANFYVLESQTGEVLFFDYGFPSMDHLVGAGSRFVEHSLAELAEHFRITRADTLVLSHYHDDHVAGANFLRNRYGTEVWAFENFVDILERPHAYRIPCVWPEPIPVGRGIVAGETVEWNEYRFEARHNPGHTWWAGALYGDIDGRRVALTGDEILVSGAGDLRLGGPVYRNRVRSDSFATGISTILESGAEILLTGHDGALEVTRDELEALRSGAADLESAWRALAADPDKVEFALDPDAVRIDPYRSDGRPGDAIEVEVEIWNHHGHVAEASASLVVPGGWRAEPEARTVRLEVGQPGRVAFTLTSPAGAEVGVRYVIAAETQLGELHLGQAAEALVVLTAA